MKRLTPTILALILTTIVSSTVFAGNIPGGRAAGHIAGGRAAGNIAGGRAAGNIAGGRATAVEIATLNPAVSAEAATRFDLENTLSGSFASLIRMLLDAGALF